MNQPYGAIWPDVHTFRELAEQRRVIPVTRRVLADGETATGLYRKLAADRPGTFLLESADVGGLWSRHSIIGVRSRCTLTEAAGQAQWHGTPPVGVPVHGDVLEVLAAALQALHTDRIPGLPPFTGGFVGYLGYDTICGWERLPQNAFDDLRLGRVWMTLASDLAVLDHSDGSVWLIANAINYDNQPDGVEGAYSDACVRLEQLSTMLCSATPASAAVLTPQEPEIEHHSGGGQRFKDNVAAGIAAIRAGEVFQVVLSQRFDVTCQAQPLDVYRCLRATNPSPYMYYVRCWDADQRDVSIVGASPEALVRVSEGNIMAHPIAGTRPRGSDPDSDANYASDLLADPKERSEHVMLVDLARNDLAKVCLPGSVDVVEFMHVERFSHVMHLVSTVMGIKADGVNAMDIIRATFPAGTLSGAPKVRAMELIDELEPTRRGIYGGIVGYLDFAGDLDCAIAIRTAVIRGGVAHIQAGAGIVADSDPHAEDLECQHKAMAVMRAVAAANTLQPAGRVNDPFILNRS